MITKGGGSRARLPGCCQAVVGRGPVPLGGGGGRGCGDAGVAHVGDVDVVHHLLDDDLPLDGAPLLLLLAVLGGCEDALAAAEGVEGALGLLGAVLGRLQLALELLHPHDVGVGDGLLLLQLALVHLDLLVELVERLLQDDDVLPVLLGLQDELLDGALLLMQRRGHLNVQGLLAVVHDLQLLDARLHLLDGDAAALDGRRLELLHLDRHGAHLRLQGFPGLVGTLELDVLLAQQRLEVLRVAAGLVGAVIGQLELAGHVVVVHGNLLQVLLQLLLDLHQLVVDVGDLGDLDGELLDLGLGAAAVGGGGVQVLLKHGHLLLQHLQLLHGGLVLRDGRLKLRAAVVVQSSQLLQNKKKCVQQSFSAKAYKLACFSSPGSSAAAPWWCSAAPRRSCWRRRATSPAR